MKVIVRTVGGQQFLATDGTWTTNYQKSIVFSAAWEADAFCKNNKISDLYEIVLDLTMRSQETLAWV